MDDEWDLYAVVRSCTTNSTDAATSGNVTVDDYEDGYDYNMETVADMINPYSYSNSGDNPSEGLEEVYKEGCSQRLPTTTTTTITTTTTTTGGFFDEQEQPSVSFDASDHSLSNESPSKKRNYYKCSTTKACGARKQVEQSHMDPTVFIVSYSGEHIHPRPTHRSPLAGSTRSNKFTPPPPDLDAAGGGDGGL
ncbi:DNA-binding WRKY [Cynara cardunculus var. scolymus]|uniref:DNA-binding WRKY n=1 Tax=Cynara cardunculus var. scolymus TaxID=59895 RepID=A0A103Y8Y3_CYNCS|nr:DNA-binding WRKY [Cynara cardunculus var. scolymus]